MKPSTVFLGEMTSREVQAFLGEHDTVLVPTGSTEQHGPHGPLATDVLVPQEVSRRIAPRVGGIVAPPLMLQTWTMATPRITGIRERGGSPVESDRGDSALAVLEVARDRWQPKGKS